MTSKLRVVAVAVLVALLAFIYMQSQDTDLSTLRGKRVVVCGASTGIGRDIALQYASHGAELVLAARNVQALNEVAEQCRSLGSPAVYVKSVSLSSEQQSKQLIEFAVDAMGGIDVLVRIVSHVLIFTSSVICCVDTKHCASCCLVSWLSSRLYIPFICAPSYMLLLLIDMSMPNKFYFSFVSLC
jgi:hypothetical protein